MNPNSVQKKMRAEWMLGAPKISLLLFLFALGCATVSKSPTPLAKAGDSDPDADDIREALFRYMISRCNTSYYKVCFVSIDRRAPGDTAKLRPGDTDPSDQFLRRFTHTPIPVRKDSDCTASSRGVFDKKSGARGLIFNVGKITRHSPTLAEIEGGYYAAGLSASGNTYTVEKRTANGPSPKFSCTGLHQPPPSRAFNPEPRQPRHYRIL
jgi:hypothetical protein